MIIYAIKRFFSFRRALQRPLPNETSAMSREDIARLYARTFSSDDGRKVLDHLQRIAFIKALGPDVQDAALRHAEGQRALVQTILRLVDTGRRP